MGGRGGGGGGERALREWMGWWLVSFSSLLGGKDMGGGGAKTSMSAAFPLISDSRAVNKYKLTKKKQLVVFFPLSPPLPFALALNSDPAVQGPRRMGEEEKNVFVFAYL